jgi:GNAT superfamily N-acetyltransferase
VPVDCADFRGHKDLPEGYAFTTTPDREAERALLETEFPNWQIPWERRFAGAREDSAAGVTHGGELVGIVYLAAENEFGYDDYAQWQYVAIDPAHRGKGLWRAMGTELMRRAEAWGFKGCVLVPDREGHHDMYVRWGGRIVGERPKVAVKPVPRWRQAVSRLTRRGPFRAVRRLLRR